VLVEVMRDRIGSQRKLIEESKCLWSLKMLVNAATVLIKSVRCTL
jgi:hypothetical protein